MSIEQIDASIENKQLQSVKTTATGEPKNSNNTLTQEDETNTTNIKYPRRPQNAKINNINGSKVLRYPSEPAISGDTDYVVFSFYKYDPPFGRGQGGDGTVKIDSGNAGYDLYAQSGIGKTPLYGSVIMYMPEDIQTQFSARWGDFGFGAVTSGALNTIGTNLNAIPAGISSIPGVIKSSVYSALTEAINKIPGTSVSLNQVLGGVSGTVLNPNVEVMYEAPDLRGFDLSFKMTPRSGNEAVSIKQICNRFKKAMLPVFGGQTFFGNDAPNLLTIPSLCQVSFMQGNKIHPYLPQYKLCAISDVSINYTPDGVYATYGDGSPVSTQIKITFKEIKLIFSQEIIEDDGANY